MYGINAELSKAYFTCFMCRVHKIQAAYVWGNFAIPPGHPYEEQRICKKCAIREHGKRSKLEDIIKERTKRWLQKQRKSQ
tara:strand:- start:588 stop:827 length:240 start_codon:yes stop_codon:yes gene_type:complete